MIIVGGRQSSNSRKLYRLASDICPRTYFIETAAELDGIRHRAVRYGWDYSRCIHAGLYY